MKKLRSLLLVDSPPGTFEEAIRSFLVGEAEFPRNISIILTLRPFDGQNILVTHPALARKDDRHI